MAVVLLPAQLMLMMAAAPPKKKKAPTKDDDSGGKYLYEVYRPFTASVGTKPQSISFSVGPPMSQFKAGVTFMVKAVSDSNLPVALTVRSRSVTMKVAPAETFNITPMEPGTLILEATQPGDATYAEATTMRLTLEIDAADKSISNDAFSCVRLLPPVAEPAPRPDLATVVSLLGNPKPFSLVAQKQTILIYTTRPPAEPRKRARSSGPTYQLSGADLAIITQAKATILKLLDSSPESLGVAKAPVPFGIDLSIPHAAALGDLTAALATLNYPKFTISNDGPGKVHIKADSTPSCAAWQAFLTDVRRIAWSVSPEPLTSKLFFLNGSDLGSALSSPAAAATPASSTHPSPTVSTVASDLLVFSSANPGDDSAVLEKKRVIAQLDLPRPEMIVNAWVMQNSSTNPKEVTVSSDRLRGIVTRFNESLQASILNAWKQLGDRIAAPDYFDKEFYDYVARRFVGEISAASAAPDHTAQEFLDFRTNLQPIKVVGDRPALGLCPADRYCLGYSSLFHPLKPRLTDLLIAVIAARFPAAEARLAVRAMEGTVADKVAPPVAESCEARDKDLLMTEPDTGPFRIRMTCFEAKAIALLEETNGSGQASGVGIMRGALADFLYQYKISQEYPHEFGPYDLTQSADALNAALNPFVEAFNRDLNIYQQFLRSQVDPKHSRSTFAKMFRPDNSSFSNDGIVTIRTISGKYSTIGTTSQSFLDSSSAPSLSDLVSNITGTASPGGSSKLGPAETAAGGVLNNLTYNQAQAILGAVKSYQSSQVKVGRGLSLALQPRSLMGASSAEIDVTLNADESADPTYYGGSKDSKSANLSRVANHDTSTRVRVESIKLFEISSFSAVLQRSRPRFPLLLPGVELPYVGTFAGVPLPAAKEYHTSTAILSAIVVPTATELAYGLTFHGDRVIDPPQGGTCAFDGSSSPPCRLRKTISLRDLDGQPIHNFHKQMVHCLATQPAGGGPSECGAITFKSVSQEVN